MVSKGTPNVYKGVEKEMSEGGSEGVSEGVSGGGGYVRKTPDVTSPGHKNKTRTFTTSAVRNDQAQDQDQDQDQERTSLCKGSSEIHIHTNVQEYEKKEMKKENIIEEKEEKEEKETIDCADVEVSVEVQEAQKLADAEVDQLEAEAAAEGKKNEEENSINVIPRLLQGAPDVNQLVAKTQEYKAKGQQLDLLLLKAETYSHFIRENQERSKQKLEQGSHFSALEEDNDEEDENDANNSSKKRKKSGGKGKGKTSKSAKGATGVPLPSSTEQDPNDTFRVTKTLVGGSLMSYQKEGLKWLLSLWENGLSGILADEMGLGKTIQIISLIAQLRASGTPGPFLIVGPLATLPNWMNEFKKWLPSCPVVLYHGSKADRLEMREKRLKRKFAKDLSFPVVVTSFEICMIDRPFLENYAWQYMILDEGHRIKNRSCRLVKELKQIPSTSRLLLTGTPIQNTLDELWSLLNFVNPMIFDNLEVFQSWFGFKNIGKQTQVEDIVDDEQQSRIVSKLHEILRPFLLRRMKRDVLSFIPLKKEIVVYCGMSSLQKFYYERVVDNTIRDTLLSMKIEGAQAVSQINQLMNLRKVSNHPFLFGEPRDNASGKYLGEANPDLLIMASGKLKLLDRMLPVLKEQGHKVLIFSQMTQMLDILQDYLFNKNYRCCRLDGSTKLQDRQDGIDLFNTDPDVFCFLISTKAGGLGINLTAADTCIIFDSDWNPHQDMQAQDRCHRIGQTSNVLVYRFLTAGTVEIEMMQKQISKKKLDRMTMHGGDFRQAGKRAGSQLTLPYLRQLLEDDVQNLDRMMTSGASANNILNNDGEANSTSTDIPQHELDMLLDRDRLFATVVEGIEGIDGVVAKCARGRATTTIPTEGTMYDIVAPQESSLQAVA